MRKFILQHVLEPDVFELVSKLVQKNDNGEIVLIHKGVLTYVEAVPKYTAYEMNKIAEVNRILISKQLVVLTEEEIEYMLDPSGMNKRLAAIAEGMEDPEVLQRMAGFKVEKVITPID
jgi:hypothetical protein